MAAMQSVRPRCLEQDQAGMSLPCLAITPDQEEELRLDDRKCMRYASQRTRTMHGGEYRCGDRAVLRFNAVNRPYIACLSCGAIDWNDSA